MFNSSLRKYAEILILSSVSVLFFGYFIFQSEYLIDLDIHFHITIAELIAKQGWVWSLPWMPHSIHADRYIDFHLIIHYLQAIFVLLTGGNLTLAAKLSGLAFLFFSVSMMILLLQEIRARHIWFWVLIFLVSSPLFSLRLLFLRGSVFFIGVIFLFILLLLRRKYYWAGIVSFFAVWTYPGFPILVIFSGIYWLVNLQEKEEENDFRIVLLPALGVLFGIIIHPAFPHQFWGFWLEFGIHSMRPEGLETIAEWTPTSHKGIPIAYGLPIVLLMIKLIIIRKFYLLEKTVLLCLVFILFTLLGAQKPIEFFIPVLVIFLGIPNQMLDFQKRRRDQAIIALVLIVSVIFSIWSFRKLDSSTINMQQAVPVPKYFEAADWLSKNTEEGEKVLVSWADFPVFFFRNRKNIYNNGLNPVYSFGKDYFRYSEIREFYKNAKPGVEFVPIKMKVRFAVLNKRHSPTSIFWLKSVPWIEKKFENENFVILQFPEKPGA